MPLFFTLTLVALGVTCASAHNVTEGDTGYIQEIWGVHINPFMYLGAKHMVTGYDHILFLFGVVFFLYRMKHIAIYVSLFAFGHSITMLIGVYYGIKINPFIIDAIIGFSVVYKALDILFGLFVTQAYAQEAWRDEVTFTLAPGESAEWKLVMEAGGSAEYRMVVEGGRVNFDLHGHGQGKSVTY